VRYYGGIKLGAGGLVRAYTDAIASALQGAPRVERIAQARFSIEIGYADETRVRHWIEHSGATLTDSRYTMTVRLTIELPATGVEAARAALRDLTQGRAGFPEHD
jgi:putative IMPACT (imprinted ancient) family translation regulator